ncbi:thiol-disulfide oxidoreductase DCC family protein [Lysobacter humi (ex Lee et al. 2017)]
MSTDAEYAAANVSRAGPVIVFDGICLLCNAWVRFLLRHDRRAHYRFAAMQSPAGAALLAAYGLDPTDPASFLLVDADGAWTDSTAIARLLRGLGLPWSIAGVALLLLPRALRDPAYRLVARNRYRWFGRREACLLPGPAVAARFIDALPAASSGSETPPAPP